MQSSAQIRRIKKDKNTKIEDKMEIGEIQVETREEVEGIQKINKKVPRRNEEKETPQTLHQRVNLKERDSAQNQDLFASKRKETIRERILLAVAEARINARAENTKEVEVQS